MPRLLVAAGDLTIAGILHGEGFGVDLFHNEAAALITADACLHYAAVVSQPAACPNRLELCRRIRATSGPPVIVVLGERPTALERIQALEAGAADCVASACNSRELVLRVGAVLRRAGTGLFSRPHDVCTIHGPILLDIECRRVLRGAREVSLTHREFELFLYFLRNEGEALSRQRILRDVWDWEYGSLSTVTTHVHRLRMKLENDPYQPELITTVWGIGYRFRSGHPAHKWPPHRTHPLCSGTASSEGEDELSECSSRRKYAPSSGMPRDKPVSTEKLVRARGLF